MRNNIHPDYHPVIFRDSSTGDEFLTRSTARSAVNAQAAEESHLYYLYLAGIDARECRDHVLSQAGSEVVFGLSREILNGNNGNAKAPPHQP